MEIDLPTRYLKPGIRDSDAIDRLTPLAETLFYRLLVTVDDFGRFDARPSMIKSQCFPVKESVTPDKCQKLMQELADTGLMILYTVNGKQYLQLTKWDNKPRATASLYPDSADSCTQVYASAHAPHTNLPVTVTGTGTETKTETAPNAPPDGVLLSVWQDFQKLRKTKKAPVTATAIEGIRREALKAGMGLNDALALCCQRGWTGFKADWASVGLGPMMTVSRPDTPDPALEKLERDRKLAVPIPENIRKQLDRLRVSPSTQTESGS